ncbi:MAG TPA: response regulator [Steroidobacteraceae bacterium]|nr:response regulator [Steroidobacteraceae bacterium]
MSLQEPLRVLLIEDAEVDAELILHLLKRFGLSVTSCRVQTEAQLRSALPEFRPSVILSDYELPGFNGQAALKVVRELDPSVPFLFVSGKMNEQVAIGALQRGAIDYVFKHNLARLGPAVVRAVKEAAVTRSQEALTGGSHRENIADSHFWQRCANEARAIAEQFSNTDARRIMLGIADGYEQIKRTIEQDGPITQG